MSDGGKGGSATVGYWYKMLLHFGLCRGPIDAFLEFRGGDRVAWRGAQTIGGIIPIDAANLWGGEKAEGGIEGECEVLFGAEAQQPNSYLIANQGEDQSAYRGKATVVYRGKYGAMSPYPKPASFKVRRIKEGWDGGCWYPAKAEIIRGPNGEAGLTLDEEIPQLLLYRNTAGPDEAEWQSTVVDKDLASFFVGSRGAQTKYPEVFSIHAKDPGLTIYLSVLDTEFPDGLTNYGSAQGAWSDDAGDTWQCTINVRTDTLHTKYFEGRYPDPLTALSVGKQNSPVILTGSTRYEIWLSDYLPEQEMEFDTYRSGVTLGATADLGPGGNDRANGYMNPAHILYDSLTAKDMMGEPVALINDASFRAAADKLFAEDFGICTTYDAVSESIEDFQRRICNVAGASLNRSRVNGQWYLDLLRADYGQGVLPVLTDDDILEWSTQPGTMDSAVNQVTVEWFDPVKKETRTTAPCQALGLIQAFGGIRSDSSSYPEVPTETLALRCAARDLRNKATPVMRFELKTTRAPYGWRPGTCFRLQAPKRGIADMICRVGEIDTGTIRQGAISLTAVQDIFGLPATSYVVPESGVNTSASRVPVPALAQRVIEAPYTEIVQRMSRADLDYLAADAGCALVMAVQPGQALNYALATAAAGEDYQQRGSGNWCPTALITAASAYLDTVFGFTAGSLLDRVVIGSAALWGDEIVRVDALDVSAGTITLGRGCVDTVPAKHAASTRIWFFDAAAASDGREYATGETVSAKCLTRMGGALLPLAGSPSASVVMAARWVRPYPPAAIRLNGLTAPMSITGDVVMTWAHRNRLLQADKLIDTTLASVTPEVGTTYTVRLLRVDTGAQLDIKTGITGAIATLSAAYIGRVAVEIGSMRDGHPSWQVSRCEFDYGSDVRITESGDVRVTEAGEIRYMG